MSILELILLHLVFYKIECCVCDREEKKKIARRHAKVKPNRVHTIPALNIVCFSSVRTYLVYTQRHSRHPYIEKAASAVAVVVR